MRFTIGKRLFLSFTVVADELGKLAERTTTATHETAEMIRTIQSDTQTAVADMEAGTERVEAGMRTAMQAASSLAEIIQAAQDVGDMVAQIATAARTEN